MRLSISDGLNLEAGAPSLAAPRVPQMAPPPTYSQPALFTGPPTALSQGDDSMKVTTGDTPVEGHTKSDPPRSGQEGTGKTRRRMGVAILVAAAGIGGYVLARKSVPPSETTSLTPPALPEGKRGNTIDPGNAVAAELVKPAKDPTKAIDVGKTIEPAVPAPGKAIDPMARPIAKGPAPRMPARTESAPPAPVEAPATEPAPTGPAAEAASAMAAVSNEHEFNKAAARSALADAADRAASCRNIDTPAGAARVAVTFAPSGKVTSAIIESGPFVGTAAGGCVASKFRNLQVPPFTSEDPVTVHRTLNF
jgi:hypothetical protein